MSVADEVYCDDVPAGDVVNQSPRAGEGIVPSLPVDLVVSLGAELLPVPDLVGLALDEATSAIKQAGLDVGGVAEEFNDDVASGHVIRQTPIGGERVPLAQSVSIVLSRETEWRDVELADTSLNSFVSNDPEFLGKSSPGFFEVVLPKVTESRGYIGSRDQSSAEMYPRFIGGLEAAQSWVHVLRFPEAEAGEYTITYEFVDGSLALNPIAIELADIAIVKLETSEGRFRVRCSVQQPGAVLLLDVGAQSREETRFGSIDYIQVDQVSVHPVFEQYVGMKSIPATWTPALQGTAAPVSTPQTPGYSFAGAYWKALRWSDEDIQDVFLYLDSEFSLLNLDEALIEVFGQNAQDYSSEEKCLALLNYVAQKMYLSPPEKLNAVP